MRYGIVFSLHPLIWEQKVSKGRAAVKLATLCPHSGRERAAERPSADTVAEGVALDHWWTAPQNHYAFVLPDVK
jgi:hypothetical protein